MKIRIHAERPVLAGDIHSHANACNLYRDCPVSAQYLLTVERILRK